MRLPEHSCPHCLSSSVPVPTPHRAYDLHACGVCKEPFVPLPDGAAAIPLPSTISVTSTRDRFEVAVKGWFLALGDRALRFRIERDRVAWSEYPALGRVRFKEGWASTARGPLRRFDLRWFESGLRGTRGYEQWTGLVLVAHDGSEVLTRHRLGMARQHGIALTTLLQWGHEVAVRPSADGYRVASPMPSRPSLAIVRERGELQHLTS